MLISLLGLLIVAAVLLDVFLTVLDPDGTSLMSARIYRWLWWIWRHFARVLPPGAGPPLLSFGAPLMIPVAIALWILGLATGFAFLYYGGLSADDVLSGGGSQPSLSSAFRLSWVTLSTIGFVEISPSNMPYSLAVALEAILGGVVLTLTITYFLNVQHIYRTYNEFVSFLYHRLGGTDDPVASLADHFRNRAFVGDALLTQMHDGIAGLHEGLRRYPIVYYYRSRRLERGLPQTLACTRRIVCGLSYALPKSGDDAGPLALAALRRAVLALVDDLEAHTTPLFEKTVARPVSFAEFCAASRGRRWAANVWVERFLNECDAMEAVAGRRPTTEADAYRRYLEWLPFVVRLMDFEAGLACDLGYRARLRPGRSSSIWSVLTQGPKDRPQPLLISRARA